MSSSRFYHSAMDAAAPKRLRVDGTLLPSWDSYVHVPDERPMMGPTALPRQLTAEEVREFHANTVYARAKERNPYAPIPGESHSIDPPPAGRRTAIARMVRRTIEVADNYLSTLSEDQLRELIDGSNGAPLSYTDLVELWSDTHAKCIQLDAVCSPADSVWAGWYVYQDWALVAHKKFEEPTSETQEYRRAMVVHILPLVARSKQPDTTYTEGHIQSIVEGILGLMQPKSDELKKNLNDLKADIQADVEVWETKKKIRTAYAAQDAEVRSTRVDDGPTTRLIMARIMKEMTRVGDEMKVLSARITAGNAMYAKKQQSASTFFVQLIEVTFVLASRIFGVGTDSITAGPSVLQTLIRDLYDDHNIDRVTFVKAAQAQKLWNVHTITTRALRPFETEHNRKQALDREMDRKTSEPSDAVDYIVSELKILQETRTRPSVAPANNIPMLYTTLLINIHRANVAPAQLTMDNPIRADVGGDPEIILRRWSMATTPATYRPMSPSGERAYDKWMAPQAGGAGDGAEPALTHDQTERERYVMQPGDPGMLQTLSEFVTEIDNEGL